MVRASSSVAIFFISCFLTRGSRLLNCSRDGLVEAFDDTEAEACLGHVGIVGLVVVDFGNHVADLAFVVVAGEAEVMSLNR